MHISTEQTQQKKNADRTGDFKVGTIFNFEKFPSNIQLNVSGEKLSAVFKQFTVKITI